MIQFFSKPLEAVALEDVEELARVPWPEGPEVEFKGTIPNKKGGIDPWLSNKNEIGEFGRDEILAEVVAFANAHGGTVVLGMDETKDKPPRAAGIRPLPRVGELARRLEDQARSCIDPPLPRLQVHPVQTDAVGAGVVIFRTGASRTAPHRLTTTKEAYVRRGSSTVKMTMREIQDMTLALAHGTEGIEKVFAGRRQAFDNWLQRGGRDVAAALRVTAVPLEMMPDPGRIFGKNGLLSPFRDFTAKVGPSNAKLLLPLPGSWSERPIIRGVARFRDEDYLSFREELHQNGVADFWFSMIPERDPRAPSAEPPRLKFFHGEILCVVANVLLLLDRFRITVGAPDAEYGLEIEITRTPRNLARPFDYLGLFGSYGTDHFEIREYPILLPRLSVGAASEFGTLIKIVDTDIFDALGSRRQPGPPIEIDW